MLGRTPFAPFPITRPTPDRRDPPTSKPVAVGPAPAVVIWFTGLSGAGKTTISTWVARAIEARGVAVEFLDGDRLRALVPQVGFGKADRDAHVRRVGLAASRLERANITVVAALISPYRESREFVRRACQNFFEIHVATPLAECERRDVKGLYARARRGEITQFTGIDDPYEPPVAADLVLDTTGLTVEGAGTRVLQLVSRRMKRQWP